jgi:hypothetical protein
VGTQNYHILYLCASPSSRLSKPALTKYFTFNKPTSISLPNKTEGLVVEFKSQQKAYYSSQLKRAARMFTFFFLTATVQPGSA